MDIWNDIKASFREGSVITRLIYVNLAVFLLFRLVQVFFFLSGRPFHLLEPFMLPASPGEFVRQPWSLVTYMFLHFDFLHILFNLLVLYWFGRLFLDYWTASQLLGLYLLGGLSGGVVFMAAYNLFPVFAATVGSSYLLGASASIIALLMATAVRDPNRDIHLMLIGRVPLKFLALFMVISYIIGITATNPGGNLAHLGGVAAGWWFAAQGRKGRDIARPFYRAADQLAHLFQSLFRSFFLPRKKVRVIHRQPPRDDHEYNRQRYADHQELNRILDKIGTEGYESLTKAEKETLFRHGK